MNIHEQFLEHSAKSNNLKYAWTDLLIILSSLITSPSNKQSYKVSESIDKNILNPPGDRNHKYNNHVIQDFW